MNKIVLNKNIKSINIPNVRIGFSVNFESFSDKDLYSYCKMVGFNARKWSRKFIATIPEVSKRKLYKKYGYCSICEFAAKMAGVSHANVEEVLRVNEKFKELPKMKALIGEVGLSKLRVVACVANKENEKELSEKVKIFTKSSLEIYVREKFGKSKNNNIGWKFLPGEEFKSAKNDRTPHGQKQIGLFNDAVNTNEKVANPQNYDKRSFAIQIDEETEFELRKFKQKLEKERKEPIDWNLALKEMVKRVNSEQKVLHKQKHTDQKSTSVFVSQTKSEIGTPKLIENGDIGSTKQKPVSRYVPVKIKHDLEQKYHGHCAYYGCNKPAEQIHHRDIFAKNKSHKNIIPLCKTHHDFVHQSLSNLHNKTIAMIFNKFKLESNVAR